MASSTSASGVGDRRVRAALRLTLLVGVIAALGPPIDDNARFLAFVGAAFLIFALPPQPAFWRYPAALAAVAIAVWGAGLVPRVAIEEGHNVFLYPERQTVLERELPPSVFAFMRDQFLQQYPERTCRRRGGCWMNQKMPENIFAFSADSLSRPAKYSRVVDSIDFAGVEELRASFANDKGYNWYSSAHDLRRETMPFFVMYELPATIVGSDLCWRGHALWETDQATFEAKENERLDCRRIEPSDVGRRVYGVSILLDAPLAMTLNLPRAYGMGNLGATALHIAGVLAIVLLCVRLPLARIDVTARLREQATLMVLALGVVAVYALIRKTDYIFGGFPPLEGGNDGLTYEGIARSILLGVADGDIGEVLRGGRDVFHNMPGLPYFRALEKILFGTTNYLYAAVLLATPFVVWSLAKTVASRRWAWWFTVAFLFAPILGPVGLWYYTFLRRGVESGFAEALATTMFLAALAMTLRHLPSGPGRYALPGFVAGLLLAAAVLCRPNYGPGAAVLILLATWRLWQHRRLGEAIVAAAGFLPVLLMLWHNYYFGGVFVVATSSAESSATFTAPPSVYVAAAADMLRFDFDGEAFERLRLQWQRWLRHGYLLPLLLWLIYEVVRGNLSENARAIAYVALTQHAVLLFWNAKVRFTYLAWALTILALLGVVERASRTLATRWRARKPGAA